MSNNSSWVLKRAERTTRRKGYLDIHIIYMSRHSQLFVSSSSDFVLSLQSALLPVKMIKFEHWKKRTQTESGNAILKKAITIVLQAATTRIYWYAWIVETLLIQHQSWNKIHIKVARLENPPKFCESTRNIVSQKRPRWNFWVALGCEKSQLLSTSS